MTEHSMAPEMLLMSKKVCDKLRPSEQEIFRDAAKESVPYMRKQWDEQEAKSLATVQGRRRGDHRGRQEVVPGRDGPGVRQVHDHARS